LVVVLAAGFAAALAAGFATGFAAGLEAAFAETVFLALVALADGFFTGISYSGDTSKDAGLYRPSGHGPPIPEGPRRLASPAGRHRRPAVL
jgi:hypothetical protein